MPVRFEAADLAKQPFRWVETCTSDVAPRGIHGTSLDRSLISGLPGFAALAGPDLDTVLAAARSCRYAKDAEVFSQASEAGAVLPASVRVIRVVRTTPDGEHVIARYIN